MRLPASARRRSRPDVKSSIPSRWSLIGCWAKFASWLADGWCKLRQAQRAWDQRLKDTGYIEGETVAIEYRLAENQIKRLSAMATELVRRQVAAIAGPITSALVARAVTTTIPMVFVAGEDPVTLGLMTSLARPGGNVTGINIFANELAAKRLELGFASASPHSPRQNATHGRLRAVGYGLRPGHEPWVNSRVSPASARRFASKKNSNKIVSNKRERKP